MHINIKNIIYLAWVRPPGHPTWSSSDLTIQPTLIISSRCSLPFDKSEEQQGFRVFPVGPYVPALTGVRRP